MNMPANFTNQYPESHYVSLDDAYLIITLGNPKQHCKFFGICKTEVYDATKTKLDFQSLTSRCLGQCIALDFFDKKIEMYFPYTGLSAQVLSQHFAAPFQIMTAFEFPQSICEAWSIPPFTILAGRYPVIREAEGLSIHFSFV